MIWVLYHDCEPGVIAVSNEPETLLRKAKHAPNWQWVEWGKKGYMSGIYKEGRYWITQEDVI